MMDKIEAARANLARINEAFNSARLTTEFRMQPEDVAFLLGLARDALDGREAQEGWRPIETAPKDGSSVILATTFRVGEASFGVCRPQTDNYRANGGEPSWRTPGLVKLFPGEPLGWMPLPAAPSPSDREG